jgi:hypothetical protein
MRISSDDLREIGKVSLADVAVSVRKTGWRQISADLETFIPKFFLLLLIVIQRRKKSGRRTGYFLGHRTLTTVCSLSPKTLEWDF